MYDVDKHKKTSKQVLTCVVTVSQLIVLKLIEALTSTSAGQCRGVPLRSAALAS
jgi:hypothetical protein